MNPLRLIQHRTTFLLLVNHGMNAATGVVFWLLFIHVVGLGAGGIGIGYTVVAIGTAVGMVAKGGLGTALMRHVPQVDSGGGRRLLHLGTVTGGGIALVGTGLLAAALAPWPWLQEITPLDWILAAVIAVLLIVAWLQDAYFLARGRPGATVWRNAAFSGGKLLLPLALVVVALPPNIAGAWAAGLAVAAAVGYWLARGPARGDTDDRIFFRSAWRNVLGNAAEFLPGLLLVPLVLALAGADAAGYFSMAWTAASLLFLAAAAIGRSALTQMVRGGTAGDATRKGLLQAGAVVVPGVLLGILLASPVLSIFGPDYANAASLGFIVLCASGLLVVPIYLYLDVLRAREITRPLKLFPLAMILLLFSLAPLLIARYGVTGASVAWFVANLPFAFWATMRLLPILKEVDTHATPTHSGHPDLE